MRRILIEDARRKKRTKHGGELRRVHMNISVRPSRLFRGEGTSCAPADAGDAEALSPFASAMVAGKSLSATSTPRIGVSGGLTSTSLIVRYQLN